VLAFLIVLFSLAALLWALVVLFLAATILSPPRMTDGKALYLLHRLSPADLGLSFEDVYFDVRTTRSRQSIRIKGWWIASRVASSKCVIILHGFADAKVGAIAWAPLWHDLGFSILAIDLPAHGESGGRFATGGFHERHILSTILNSLRLERETQTQEIILFGASYGAAVALATAALRDDLAGVVLDSPFASYEQALGRRLDLARLMDRSVFQPACLLIELICAAKFSEVAPVVLIPKISAPILLIQSGQDVAIPTDARRSLEAAAGMPADGFRACVTFEDAPHLHGLITEPNRYREVIKSFLARLPSAKVSV